jgi:hypothetical protein
MRLRQPANPTTDLEANQGGRGHWSVVCAPRDENQRIPYSCPACKSENTQRLSTVHMTGLSQFSAVTSGIGWTGTPIFAGGWTTGISQTQLSQVAAPPTKRTYSRGLLLLFSGPLIGAAPFAIMEHLHGPSQTYELLAAIVVILLEIGAIASLLRGVAYNKNVWPELFHKWQSCVMCLRCGQVFHP